ncbi:hypothetical protein TNCV_1228861 [Trichonephila clavipes]|nr:hypothetical protein TNCV_1228861 [Trichonephila clavipes]
MSYNHTRMDAVDFLHHENPPTWAIFGVEGQLQINYAIQLAEWSLQNSAFEHAVYTTRDTCDYNQCEYNNPNIIIPCSISKVLIVKII